MLSHFFLGGRGVDLCLCAISLASFADVDGFFYLQGECNALSPHLACISSLSILDKN